MGLSIQFYGSPVDLQANFLPVLANEAKKA
jgi:hypothetical protein